LSAELQVPSLPDLGREPGELEPLVDAALQANPRLQAERAQLQAAEDRVRVARLSYRGELRGEFEAGAYNRRFSRDDPFAAGLVLELPLYTGGAKDAELAKAWAEVRERRAGIARQELELRQAVLDLWLEIGSLRARLEELDSLGRYRDLYLDRSRALYELEVTADLGDAMVGTSDHRLQQARAQYDIALAWAHLDALTGRLLQQAPEQTDPEQEETP
jgi:outer membrane protein TolC